MLKEVILPDGAKVAFEYDVLGRRTRKTVGWLTTHWVWDGDPIHEWQENGESGSNTNDGSDRGTAAEPISWVYEPGSFSPFAKVAGD